MISTYLTAVVMYYILGYNDKDGKDFSFETALMFGSIISATDPVAVVALLKELGASRRLATLIEGESLLNDGTAMVLFLIMKDFATGNPHTIGYILGAFVRLSFGGILLGVISGILMS
jgi:NhaP-type Na+/H+ or K+/H+ antiporter